MKLAQEVFVLNFSQNIFFNYILGKKKKNPAQLVMRKNIGFCMDGTVALR